MQQQINNEQTATLASSFISHMFVARKKTSCSTSSSSPSSKRGSNSGNGNNTEICYLYPPPLLSAHSNNSREGEEESNLSQSPQLLTSYFFEELYPNTDLFVFPDEGGIQAAASGGGQTTCSKDSLRHKSSSGDATGGVSIHTIPSTMSNVNKEAYLFTAKCNNVSLLQYYLHLRQVKHMDLISIREYISAASTTSSFKVLGFDESSEMCIGIVTSRPYFQFLMGYLIYAAEYCHLQALEEFASPLRQGEDALDKRFPPGNEVALRCGTLSSLMTEGSAVRPDISLFHNVDVPLSTLLYSFSFQSLQLLHSIAIQDGKILFVGQCFGHASALVHSFCASLYPFRWGSVCLPVVPSSLIDLVSTELPFIAGTTYELLPTVLLMPLVHSCIWIADGRSGKVGANHGAQSSQRYGSSANNDSVVELLPLSLKLKDSIKKIVPNATRQQWVERYAQFDEQLKSTSSSTATPSQQQKLMNNWRLVTEDIQTLPPAFSFTTQKELLTAFLDYWVMNVVGNYRKGIQVDSTRSLQGCYQGGQGGGTMLLPEKFLSINFGKEGMPVLKGSLTHCVSISHMFQQWKEDVILLEAAGLLQSVRGPYELFFQRCLYRFPELFTEFADSKIANTELSKQSTTKWALTFMSKVKDSVRAQLKSQPTHATAVGYVSDARIEVEPTSGTSSLSGSPQGGPQNATTSILNGAKFRGAQKTYVDPTTEITTAASSSSAGGYHGKKTAYEALVVVPPSSALGGTGMVAGSPATTSSNSSTPTSSTMNYGSPTTTLRKNVPALGIVSAAIMSGSNANQRVYNNNSSESSVSCYEQAAIEPFQLTFDVLYHFEQYHRLLNPKRVSSQPKRGLEWLGRTAQLQQQSTTNGAPQQSLYHRRAHSNELFLRQQSPGGYLTPTSSDSLSPQFQTPTVPAALQGSVLQVSQSQEAEGSPLRSVGSISFGHSNSGKHQQNLDQFFSPKQQQMSTTNFCSSPPKGAGLGVKPSLNGSQQSSADSEDLFDLKGSRKGELSPQSSISFEQPLSTSPEKKEGRSSRRISLVGSSNNLLNGSNTAAAEHQVQQSGRPDSVALSESSAAGEIPTLQSLSSTFASLEATDFVTQPSSPQSSHQRAPLPAVNRTDGGGTNSKGTDVRSSQEKLRSVLDLNDILASTTTALPTSTSTQPFQQPQYNTQPISNHQTQSLHSTMANQGQSNAGGMSATYSGGQNKGNQPQWSIDDFFK